MADGQTVSVEKWLEEAPKTRFVQLSAALSAARVVRDQQARKADDAVRDGVLKSVSDVAAAGTDPAKTTPVVLRVAQEVYRRRPETESELKMLDTYIGALEVLRAALLRKPSKALLEALQELNAEQQEQQRRAAEAAAASQHELEAIKASLQQTGAAQQSAKARTEARIDELALAGSSIPEQDFRKALDEAQQALPEHLQDPERARRKK